MLDGGYDQDADVLNGGAGDDRVTVRDFDRALGGSGFDTLVASISGTTEQVYSLNFSRIGSKSAADIGVSGMKAGQFEKLELVLSGAASGTSVVGSKGDDTITIVGQHGGISVSGGKGGDVINVRPGATVGGWIDGGSGDDRLETPGNGSTLKGGSGSDLFVLFWPDTADTILDFGKKDLLLVQRSSFENLDKANVLVSGNDPVANSAKGQFLYDTDDGRLMYDPDGTGSQAAAHIVTLGNVFALKASSFLIDF
jgi:Ca2+-binding RTX toxin-like protein